MKRPTGERPGWGRGHFAAAPVIQAYATAYQRLRNAALPVEDSAKLIDRVKAEYA